MLHKNHYLALVRLSACTTWLMWLIKSYKWEFMRSGGRTAGRGEVGAVCRQTQEPLYSNRSTTCDLKREIKCNLYATAGPAPLSSHNVMTLEKWSNKSQWRMIHTSPSRPEWSLWGSPASLTADCRVHYSGHFASVTQRTIMDKQVWAHSYAQMRSTLALILKMINSPRARLHLTNDITGSAMRICRSLSPNLSTATTK